jgi:hypothetical protein
MKIDNPPVKLLKIVPISDPVQLVPPIRTGTLRGLNAKEISSKLEFKPNTVNSRQKGPNSRISTQWDFQMDGDIMTVWDYMGSAGFLEFSVAGPIGSWKRLFPEHYYPDFWAK